MQLDTVYIGLCGKFYILLTRDEISLRRLASVFTLRIFVIYVGLLTDAVYMYDVILPLLSLNSTGAVSS